MKRLFVELPGQIHACFGGIDVLVEIKNQVIGNNGIAGCEESDQPIDQVTFGGGHLRIQITDVSGKIDFFDGPGVLDGVPIHFVELWIAHGAEG